MNYRVCTSADCGAVSKAENCMDYKHGDGAMLCPVCYDTTEEFYPPTLTIYRAVYNSLREWRAAYHDCCQHYGYKARVHGGWKFFETQTDYETWKRQR